MGRREPEKISYLSLFFLYWHMSGHSKWSQIKRKKAFQDAKKGAVFTKLSQSITMAARTGGSSPETNFKLKLAVEKARKDNMPMANIERAIQKGAGYGEGSDLFEQEFEVFGPAETAMIIKAVTNNKNRTLTDIKHILSKHGFTLGNKNSVAWMFDMVGELHVLPNKNSISPDDIVLHAIDAGALDVNTNQNLITIFTQANNLSTVHYKLNDKKIVIDSMQISYRPKNRISITNATDIEKLHSLINDLRAYDDITEIHINTDTELQV